MISGEALKLYQLIEAEPGIETRALRARSGLKATDQKKEYNQAINDLQATMDIVISGVKERSNYAGDINGWNSTSFETSNYWMTNNQVDTSEIDVTEAKVKLQEWLKPRCSQEANEYLRKLFSL